MTETMWDGWRARLAGELATLTDREFVILGEPAPEPPPRRGLFRRRPDPPAMRYVQFLRVGDELTAECVGAKLFGGSYDITPENHERLRALGWLAPGDTSETTWGAPNYRVHATPADAERLAQLAVDSLGLLDVSPGELALTRDR